jgi:hypothetical protein
MLFSEHLAPDGQRLLVALLGLGILSLVIPVFCQVVGAGGRVGMVVSQDLAADSQRLATALLGLAILALGVLERG